MLRPVCNAVLIAAVLLGGSACTTTRAATPVDRPALDVPPVPPRVIVPLPPPDASPVLEPVEELPNLSGERSPTKPRPPRDKPDPTKPADPKVEPPVEAPAQPPPAQAPPQLRLEGSNSAQLNAQVRDTINRARGIIDRIDRNSLSNEHRRKAFDDAKLFVQQAEDAVKNSNFVFAKELADKAERLAKELQGR
jgi:hypothetical protein